MGNKKLRNIVLYIAAIVVSVATVIICFILNFEFNMDGSVIPTIRNVIITLSYITMWQIILIIGIITRNHRIVKYCLEFWISMLVISILMIYLEATGTENSWVQTIWFLLVYNQWYGTEFFASSIMAQPIVVAFISLCSTGITAIFLKHIKSNNNVDKDVVNK